ncbi:hypothetical protein Golob_018089 [Gossypium lobatum]|uniref:Transposase MuDR plant domain-containing protein n=1 Tax=Gossypium lobatum TaxID=34289 RepID=A0A7J8M9L7_9ROSI|nr:hypothetical protein [Gossypium lobatum]
MLDFWVKFKEIDLYVEHEVDNLIIIDKIYLLTVGEGDDEGVESDGEGDVERLESGGEGEGDVRGVQADWEGVSATSIEVDEYVGMESDGQISLGSIVGEDNDSEVTADEYASDFATSNGVDNVAIAISREEEDGNETERARYSPAVKCLQIKMFQDEHHCLVSFKNKMVTAAMIG